MRILQHSKRWKQPVKQIFKGRFRTSTQRKTESTEMQFCHFFWYTSSSWRDREWKPSPRSWKHLAVAAPICIWQHISHIILYIKYISSIYMYIAVMVPAFLSFSLHWLLLCWCCIYYLVCQQLIIFGSTSFLLSYVPIIWCRERKNNSTLTVMDAFVNQALKSRASTPASTSN